MQSDVLIRERVEYLSGLNELDARLYVGLWALELGWGGISKVNEITGKSMDTIRKGISEIQSKSYKELKDHGRIRKEGGGRKKIIDKYPRIEKKLEEILDESTAGDPMGSLKWTNKSTTAIAKELQNQKNKISQRSIHRILKERGYTLQSNKKKKETGGKSVTREKRDNQFRYINKMCKEFALKEQPSISVDTKKKELVGEFKNTGRTWRKKGQPEEVNIYDFPSLAKGKVVPYGAYDIQKNNGFVNVGISSDTSEFSVESIRQWWKQLGKKHYPKAKELLITADCGGSNGYRNRGWKYYLQELVNETDLRISVIHFPPGTSKWNKIEHRLFSFISMNWKGKPLISYQVIINFIKATKTDKGLEVYARLDKKKYKKGKKFSDKEMSKINLQRHDLHPEWNYTISPNN